MKKGQIGETITWFVATIIIIIVLMVLIVVVTSFYGDFKGIKKTTTSVDVLASKSFFSWVLTEDSGGKMIYEQLQEEDNLNDFNGLLAEKIFKNFYSEEYQDVWVGMNIDRVFSPYAPNKYFGHRPTEVRGGDVHFGQKFISHVTEEVILDENKSIQMVLKVK